MTCSGGADLVMGHQKKFEIDGSEYCVFDVEPEATAPSKAVSCPCGVNNGYRLRAAGMKEATMKVQMYLNLDENPYGDPPAIEEGTYLSNVKYYPDRDDASQFWHFPSAYVARVGEKSDEENPNVVSFDLENDGIYYKPTG
jgi:hypothetical protein